jgi:outer membrane protein assembly factor BamB
LTLAASPDHIWIAGPTYGLEARAAVDGRVIWKNAGGVVGPPALAEGLILGVSDRRLVAWDRDTGAERWAVQGQTAVAGVTSAEGLVVLADDRGLSAYRAADGIRLWGYEIASTNMARPLILPDAVFAATRDSIVALDPSSGAVRWTAPADMVPTGFAASAHALYFGVERGGVCSVGRRSGRLNWCFSVRIPAVDAPAVGTHGVYAAFLDNTVRVFDLEDGARIETYSLGARPAASPTVAEGAWVLPLVSGQVFLGSLDPSQPTSKLSPSDFDTSPSLEAAAVGADRRTIAVLTVSPTSRSLTTFRMATPTPVSSSSP